MASVGATRWYVLRTNPKCEQRAQASLAEIGFGTFAPRIGKTVIHHRSKKEVRREFPLFVGYIFIAMQGPHHWGYVRNCDGVKAVLGDGDGTPIPIPAQEVEEFHQAFFCGEFDDHRHVQERRRRKARKVFTHGQEVMITSGPLSGHKATVNSAHGASLPNPKARSRVQVMAQMLSGLVEMSVPSGYLEAA